MTPVRKIAFGYAGQFYAAVVGLLMLPFLVRQLGAESYGLVGFFATLQSWFFLLDAGMFQTTSREVTRCAAGAVSPGQLWGLLARIEVAVAALAVVGFTALVALAPTISAHWLKIGELPPATVTLSLRLMAAAIALRWLTGLYRQILLGLNQQEWMAGYTIATSTLRFVVVLPVLRACGGTPLAYFAWQVVVSGMELGAVWWRARRSLPRRPLAREQVAWAALAKFSAGVAGASVLWIAVTQVDKLLLSRLLPLAEFGVASVVGLLAGGIMFAVTPVGSVALPTLTRLYAGRTEQEFVRTYRTFSEGVAVIAAAASAPLVLCSSDVMRVWTGAEATSVADRALMLYAVGNLLSAVNSPGYYLQYAVGSLRWHNIGSAVSLGLLIAGLMYCVPRFGLIGAGAVWAGINIAYLAAWMPILHSRFLRGRHWEWLIVDIGLPVLASLAAAWYPAGRSWGNTIPWIIAKLLVVGMVAAGAGTLCASLLRAELVPRLARILGGKPAVIA